MALFDIHKSDTSRTNLGGGSAKSGYTIKVLFRLPTPKKVALDRSGGEISLHVSVYFRTF